MEKVKITEVCDFQGGTQPPKNEWKSEISDGYIRMLQIRDFTQREKNYVEYIKEKITTKKCEPDDILIGRYGASIGKICTGLEGAYNVALIKTIPNNKKLTKKFLFYILISDSFQNFIINVGSRAAQAGFNKEDLENFQIPLPNLSTQQKIANILDKADELRQYNKQLIEKYDALTQSLFLDMFGDPVRNEKGWNLTKFSNVLTKIESGWSPVCENYSRKDENEWAVLKLGAVSYGTYNLKENKKYEFDIPNSKIDCEVKQGDLLFTRKNTYHMVGKTAFVYETESRLLLPDTVFRLVYNIEKVNPLFLYYLLNHNKFSSEIQSLASGTSGSMPNISKAKLLAKDLICPSVELQNQFAERVAIIEVQKQQAQEALAKSEELFQGLLQKAFNGELN